ncbi:radical SAM protein [Paraliomyxa miuraensis]|uniref:radical SAM protein n=1 Tax=Paraliomyxa miuraensis TaxID=376150 RepID=UPI002252A57E|nr:radical SAM protein [Paraliomyxa miuraensis]MCX4247254.1 radical SAM protein [Paraliomyxa miuraensis]
MRVARVLTNETCNQACRFCDAVRPRERASIAAASAVRTRIDAAHREGVRELVLTGGEPTLRPDLPAIVSHAAREPARVVLETNAALVTPALAERLAAAGLHTARVHLPAWGDALDAITGRPGDAARTAAGLSALCDAGITLEASIPVVLANLESLASLPGQLAATGLPFDRLWMRLPIQAPDPSTLAPLPAMLQAAGTFIDQARTHALPVSLEPATFLPPCLFERPGRVASIYALSRGGAQRPGYIHPPACEPCTVRDRCPGLPSMLVTEPTRANAPVPHPLSDDRLRRRLTVIASPRAQIERELVTRERYRRPDGTTVPAHIVRIGFRCNQNCHFCFVSTHLPAPPVARVEAAIDEIAALRGILVLSGGEPTLDPRLPDYVRRGKAHGVHEVELQTNATRLSDPALCEALRDAGVDIAFVSLHGATAAVSDEVTAAPGTFVRTLAGLDRLRDTGIHTRINFVLCEQNRHEFPAFVSLVAERWPGAAITISFVGMSTDLVPRERWLVPRYRDVLPPLREGLARARTHGLEVGGFDSMCGLPLCLVPDDLQPFFSLAELPPGGGDGEFVKPAPCDGCVLQSRCFGLRRGYASMYGWDELRPVTAVPPPTVPPPIDPA